MRREYWNVRGLELQTIPSMTYTSDPTSPSLMMQLSLPYSTGYIQSTISWICDSSRFFIKSLSRIASFMRSLDLGKEREDLLAHQTTVFIVWEVQQSRTASWHTTMHFLLRHPIIFWKTWGQSNSMAIRKALRNSALNKVSLNACVTNQKEAKANHPLFFLECV